MDIRNYLRNKGLQWSEVQRPAGIVAVLNCPFCGDNEKKFAVSLGDGAFNCLRTNNCGVKGSWFELQKMFNDKPARLDSDSVIIRPRQVEYKKPEVKGEKLKDDGMKFLIERGFSKETIQKFRIGQRDKWLMFPYHKDGNLVNVKYRHIDEKKYMQEKNAEPCLFYRDACAGEALLICEGELDAMAWSEYNVPAVSVPSGATDLRWIEHEWDFLNKFKKIYLNFDADPAGQANIEKIVNRLGRWRCYNIVLPLKDCNECLKAGIDVKASLAEAREFDPVILKRATDYEAEIIELYENPAKLHGRPTPFNGLNEILKGWREEELTIWSGRNASGKSTHLNNVIIDLITDEPTIIASFEMPPKRYLRWMLMNITGLRYIEPERVKQELHKISKNLFVLDVVGECKPDMILDTFDYAARKYGVKNFVVDSLMKVDIGEPNLLEKQKEFVNSLINNLAIKHKGHVHLVAHPRKGFKDSDKPGKVDISGSGDITNLAHNVIIVWRPEDDYKEKQRAKGKDVADSVLIIKKNREWGTEGLVNFDFDAESKKFFEWDSGREIKIKNMDYIHD